MTSPTRRVVVPPWLAILALGAVGVFAVILLIAHVNGQHQKAKELAKQACATGSWDLAHQAAALDDKYKDLSKQLIHSQMGVADSTETLCSDLESGGLG